MSRPWASVPNQNVAARRLLGVHQVGVHDRIGMGQPRREDAGDDHDREQRAADHEIGSNLSPDACPQPSYLMRGSISAQSTSTSVLTQRKNSTITRIEPWTTGMSRRVTLSTRSDPSPGQENSFSITTACPITLPNCRPTVVRTMHERIAGKMPAHDPALAHALRAGGADEIRVHDLEHRRPGRAGQERQRRDAERDRRQDEIAQAPVAVAEARKPAELQGEEVHQQQARARTSGSDRPETAPTMERVSTRLPGFRAATKPSGTPMHDREQHGGEAQLQASATCAPRAPWRPAGACETRCRDRARELQHILAEAHVDADRSRPNSLFMRSITCASMHAAPVVAQARREGAGNDAEQDEDQQRDRQDDRHGLQQAPHAGKTAFRSSWLRAARASRTSQGDACASFDRLLRGRR